MLLLVSVDQSINKIQTLLLITYIQFSILYFNITQIQKYELISSPLQCTKQDDANGQFTFMMDLTGCFVRGECNTLLHVNYHLQPPLMSCRQWSLGVPFKDNNFLTYSTNIFFLWWQSKCSFQYHFLLTFLVDKSVLVMDKAIIQPM